MIRLALLLVLAACNRGGVLTPNGPNGGGPCGYLGNDCGNGACCDNEYACTPTGCEFVGPPIPGPDGMFAARREAGVADGAKGP